MKAYTIKVKETTDTVLAESEEEARLNWYVQYGEKYIEVEK